MSPFQIERVRDSFVHILFAPDAAAACFYRRLFERAPETRAMFRTDMAEQGRKLMLTLGMAVTGLSRLETMLPALRSLAVRHVGYGVQDHHYAIVGQALTDMLGEVLGDALDAETADAWRLAYALIAGEMIAATRPAQAA